MRPRNTHHTPHFSGRYRLLALLLMIAALMLSAGVAGTASTESSATRQRLSTGSVEGTGSEAPAVAGETQDETSLAASECTTPRFALAPGSPFAVGGSPGSVAVGDFNRDGKLDLAVANYSSDNVTIRLGDGAGGFPTATGSTVGAGNGPTAVAVGDFNNDGKQDLAVTNLLSHNMTIRLGNGAGGFPDANASTVSTHVGPSSVAVGDFNQDGNQDLALAHFGESIVNIAGGVVSIRLGNGTGGFPAANASTVGAGQRPSSIAVGDFNRDGKQDLVITNIYSDDFNYTATIRLGDGAGGFPDTMSSAVRTGGGPSSVAVGDFDRDGKQDLAVANFYSDNVMIRLGNGAGGFPDSRVSTVGAGDEPQHVAIGDFNRDGKPDLAVANSLSNNVMVRFGDGAGGFPASMALMVGVGNRPRSLAIGDFNRDGKPDLVVPNGSAGNVMILLNTCTATPCSGKISSLTFDKNPVIGGDHVTGIVRLTCALNKDLVVRLTSNKAAAQPDVGTVTIPAGQTRATFGITTLPIQHPPRDVVFTASATGGYVRATLHVNP
jgi:hypothetical protein